jgi:hypothetical protein
MDLVGPLPTAQGNCKFAAVVVDYFTKWVEAKALVNITAPTIQKFFWQNVDGVKPCSSSPLAYG